MKRSAPFYLFILLSAIYVALVMLLPSDPATLARYHISQGQARLLNLTIVIPLIGIWYLALNGFLRFKQYSELIRSTNEGWAFTLLSNGLMVLAFGLPINSIISAVTTYISNHNANLMPLVVITKNYVILLIALIAFGLLARGAILLFMSRKQSIGTKPVMPLFMAPLTIVLTSIFTWLVVSRPVENQADISAYHLPNWLIIFTIVIPYVTAWGSGLLALYYLNRYRSKVSGTMYKQAFGELAIGIGVVTLVSVLLQLLAAISGQINRLRLTPILTLIYFLVVLYAVGFWYIAHGSKKLQTFEEV